MPDKRSQTESDFKKIDLVADECGIEAVIAEGNFHGENLAVRLADMPGFYDRFLWTFLEHQSYFDTAFRFREADEKPQRYWRERTGIPPSKPRDDAAAKKDLAHVLKAYFRPKEGRGHICSVEVFRRGSLYYYFAYLEDYSLQPHHD